jgi:hypothetical protein
VSADLAALLMADYFWSDAFKLSNPHTLTPPLPVVIELPRQLLMRVFVEEEVEREVYKYLLGGGQADTGAPTFFLQDFLTLMNAFGQSGDVIQVGPIHRLLMDCANRRYTSPHIKSSTHHR